MKRFFQFLFMPCEGYTELLSASMDTRLSRLDRVAVRLHTIYCRSCARYRKQIRQLQCVLRGLDDVPPAAGNAVLDDDARRRMLAALRRERP